MSNSLNYVKAIRNNMFAKRDSFDEAMEYAYLIAKGSGSTAHVMTAIQVVLNTVASDLEKLIEKENV